MSRFDARGGEIGWAYQQACIESWKRAGFEPVSVNWKEEPFGHTVRMVPVSRNASAITGRPHIYFADLLAVASLEAQGRPFALLNADLVLVSNTDLAARVAQLRPGELVFSRRLDIDQPSQTSGIPWRYGYDFFAGHANDLSGIADAGMVFGAPWWDHFFPLLMFIRGCRIHQTEPVAAHLKHADRWSWPVWETLGQRFVSEMETLAADSIYSARLQDALSKSDGDPYRMLNRVSDVNLLFLDAISRTA